MPPRINPVQSVLGKLQHPEGVSYSISEGGADVLPVLLLYKDSMEQLYALGRISEDDNSLCDPRIMRAIEEAGSTFVAFQSVRVIADELREILATRQLAGRLVKSETTRDKKQTIVDLSMDIEVASDESWAREILLNSPGLISLLDGIKESPITIEYALKELTPGANRFLLKRTLYSQVIPMETTDLAVKKTLVEMQGIPANNSTSITPLMRDLGSKTSEWRKGIKTGDFTISPDLIPDVTDSAADRLESMAGLGPRSPSVPKDPDPYKSPLPHRSGIQVGGASGKLDDQEGDDWRTEIGSIMGGDNPQKRMISKRPRSKMGILSKAGRGRLEIVRSAKEKELRADLDKLKNQLGLIKAKLATPSSDAIRSLDEGAPKSTPAKPSPSPSKTMNLVDSPLGKTEGGESAQINVNSKEGIEDARDLKDLLPLELVNDSSLKVSGGFLFFLDQINRNF
jgi:hypothetical protein